MSEYLIQSSTLEDIADAIRSKTGGSALINPEDMADEIDSIQTGGTDDRLAKLIANTLTEIIDDEITTLSGGGISSKTAITTFICHNITSATGICFNGCSRITNIALPKLLTIPQQFFFKMDNLVGCDLGATSIGSLTWQSSAKFKTLILRSNSVVTLSSSNSFDYSDAFKSGGTGGDIYIPKSLFDHLGDGSSSDYKAALRWATLDSRGTVTWHAIEGSQYETHYIDGTAIS